uniref:RGS domain-containing protein n=1 Tax=Sexangularia sp. CB-2014 TaxID=1486929 RepID=A0A7S1YFL7_9EUKA|mmetsp:Transcript_2010/g.6344  ORF Transcript_2010/g.6344 Transcript_2010/m.6344 type:complete len:550 (+) Transcript_2010:99-1748(+)
MIETVNFVLAAAACFCAYLTFGLHLARGGVYPLNRRPQQALNVYLFTGCVLTTYYVILPLEIVPCIVSRAIVWFFFTLAAISFNAHLLAVTNGLLVAHVSLALAQGQTLEQMDSYRFVQRFRKFGSLAGMWKFALCFIVGMQSLFWGLALAFPVSLHSEVTEPIFGEAGQEPIHLVNDRCVFIADYAGFGMLILFIIAAAIFLNRVYARHLRGDSREDSLGLRLEMRVLGIVFPFVFIAFAFLGSRFEWWLMVLTVGVTITLLPITIAVLSTFTKYMRSDSNRQSSRRAVEEGDTFYDEAAATGGRLRLYLKVPQFRDAFASFLRSELSVENLLFVEFASLFKDEVEATANNAPHDEFADRWESFENIFKLFIAKDASLPLNIRSSESRAIHDVWLNGDRTRLPPVDIFEPSAKSVLYMLEGWSLARFLSTYPEFDKSPDDLRDAYANADTGKGRTLLSSLVRKDRKNSSAAIAEGQKTRGRRKSVLVREAADLTTDFAGSSAFGGASGGAGSSVNDFSSDEDESEKDNLDEEVAAAESGGSGVVLQEL